jgi:hypothetical protein
VTVWRGGPAGIDPTPFATLVGDQWLSSFGVAVATAGDVNGDSYADLLVGASDYVLDGLQGHGKAFLYLGGPWLPQSSTPAWSSESYGQASIHVGRTVATAGDVNGDGFSDLIVGIPSYADPSEPEKGAIAVYYSGKGGLPSTSPERTGYGVGAYYNLGRAVSTAGDTNADGYDEVVVGWPGFDNGAGALKVYLGAPDGAGSEGSIQNPWLRGRRGRGARILRGGKPPRGGFPLRRFSGRADPDARLGQGGGQRGRPVRSERLLRR